MKVETTAAVYKADNFHSNKTNKDYFTLGLVIEGQAGNFFISEKTYADYVKTPVAVKLRETGIPQPCLVELDIRLNEKGAAVNVASVRAIK